MARQFVTVVADIIDVVPDNWAYLRSSLGRLRCKAGFVAPEAQSVLWSQLCDLLTDTIGRHEAEPENETEPWMLRVHEIVEGPK